MDITGIIQNEHDIEIQMSCVLNDAAEWSAANNNGYVPYTLFSDLCLDARNMAENDVMNKKFLWHVHAAGTYLHWLNIDNIEDNEERYMSWRHDFLTWDDWTFTELNYRWGCRNHPMDRVFYFDGKSFREVSRDTALLIWRYTGLELIHKHEDCQIEVTA